VGAAFTMPLGREFAWQSTQDAGCARLAAVREAWKRAGVVPPRLAAQPADMLVDGATWQTLQSCGTRLAAVGSQLDVPTPKLHATASCFISPEAGVRTGFVAAGPTKPVGIEVAWQSRHADGCARLELASDAWRAPG